MRRLTPWLVLALLGMTPAQGLQARTLSEPTAFHQAVAANALAMTGGQGDLLLGAIQSSEQVTPTVRSPQPTIRSPLGTVTRTVFAQATDPLTVTVSVTPTTPLTVSAPTPTPTTSLAPTAPTTATTVVTATSPAPPDAAVGPVQGTIIANRTQAAVRFFAEGQTYDLAPLRSLGLALPRETGVLNLFNCDANTAQAQSACFWDPYLLNRDGFYEVVTGQEAGKTVGLVLQEAGTPPVNQIWVQNRIGALEMVFYNNQQYDLQPSAVQEFTGQPNTSLTLYLRSCLELGDKSVCEWRPQSVATGVYYALTELATAGSVPGSRLQIAQLTPVVGSTQVGPLIETPAQLVCAVLVPALNVRSGPGLEYEIIAKVRGTETEPGSVLVVGRDLTGLWLAVDAVVAPGGWITGSANFVDCQGDVAALPETEISDGRLAATPTPIDSTTVAPSAPLDAAQPTEGEAVPGEATPTASAPITTTIPDGQALLFVNNGFDQVVRFTLDQKFRVETGPSEYDMEPGQALSIAVFPGQVAFSVSTPWRGLSGNAEFFIDSKQSRTLWLLFVPDPDGSGNWLLQYD